jgi:anti-sigma factor RsiW
MTEMPCVSGVDLLMDYFEGVLPPQVVAAVDGHVAGCDRCMAFVASYRATPAILREATDLPLPSAAETALLSWLRELRGGPS